MNSINQQNKLHFALCPHYEELMIRSHHISWLGMLVSRQSDKLNKRVSFISPRRGKKQARKLAEEAMGHSYRHSQAEVDEIAELFEVEI